MFFPASEYLLVEGVAGDSVIRRVDEFLHDRQPRDLLDPRQIAGALELPVDELEFVFDAYVTRGVLQRRDMLECSECDFKASADDVSEAREEGDDFPCEGISCENDLAADDDASVIPLYSLLDTPTA